MTYSLRRAWLAFSIAFLRLSFAARMEGKPASLVRELFQKTGPLTLRRLVARLRDHARTKRDRSRRRAPTAAVNEDRVDLNVGFESNPQQLTLRVPAVVVHSV